MKKYYPALIALLFIFIIVTLFPPYNWGNERLKTQAERKSFVNGIGYLNDILPVKQYDLVFNNSKKEIFVGWGLNDKENKSTKKYLILERHLISEELILNYILSILFAAIFLLVTKKIEPIYKSKKFQIILMLLAIIIISSFIVYGLVSKGLYKKEIATVQGNSDSYRSRTSDRGSRR